MFTIYFSDFTGFEKAGSDDIAARIEHNVTDWLNNR